VVNQILQAQVQEQLKAAPVNSGLKLPKKSRSIPQKQRIRFPKIIAIRSPHIRSLRLLFPRTRA
ncbi:hypothetical protein, partial [Alicyclobacillus sendaiensis]|uniref:hypothetical protein n=1 Tax=Alicyclobacillus sendaiensis TaxID=192387 RepID=UPI0026F47D48